MTQEDKNSAQIRKNTEERCFEARKDADFWAANCKEMKTEQEIIEEANKRYSSFFERDHFIKEAEEVFMLKEYRKNQITMTPEEKKIKYYVYGFWHIHEGKPYVMKNGSAEVYEFDEIDDALKKLKELSLSNVNITWCLTWDKEKGLLDLL